MKKIILALFISFAALLPFGQESTSACTDFGYGSCETFSDVSNHPYKEAIRYVQEQGIVNGYPDGSYQPDATINRAEFTKILVESVFGTPAESTERCFSDVEKGMWFEKYVCEAKKKKILSGYQDGEFKAANKVNFVEAAKIFVNAFEIDPPMSEEGEEWYGPFVAALDQKKAIPVSITKADHPITRGEMAEIIQRIRERVETSASLTACDFISSRCPQELLVGFGDESLTGIDMQKVRQTWLQWYNEERKKLGLQEYKYHNELNRTAYIWSDTSLKKGELSHKRPGQTAYYDYNIINEWFRNLGLQFQNVQRVTFSENIGWGPFSCKNEDCTDELLSSIKSTFDFYMAEKNNAYRPHYNSVMNQYFHEIGLGIAIGGGKYYLTVHYTTKIL